MQGPPFVSLKMYWIWKILIRSKINSKKIFKSLKKTEKLWEILLRYFDVFSKNNDPPILHVSFSEIVKKGSEKI